MSDRGHTAVRDSKNIIDEWRKKAQNYHEVVEE